jgi:hypothetical protein
MIDKALAQLEWEKENEVHYAIGKDPDGEPIWCVPVRYLDALEHWVEAQFEATRRTLEALRAEFMSDGQAAAKASKDRPGALGSIARWSQSGPIIASRPAPPRPTCRRHWPGSSS